MVPPAGLEPTLEGYESSFLTFERKRHLVAGVGIEPTYDIGYEPTELPVLYPAIYNWYLKWDLNPHDFAVRGF